MEGARGRIKLPGFVPQGGGFSANVYGQYGSVGDTLETGTINHNCPDDEEKEEANHWFAYANLQVPAGDVEAGPCFKRLDKSSETGFAVITSDRGWAHVEISGQVKAIQENEHRYHIGDGYYSTVYGEAKRFGREIGGDFLGAQLLKENSGWINPTKFNSGPVDKGDGYIAKYRGGDISGFFCVTYQPRRNCNAP
jgi:hypothetical protein